MTPLDGIRNITYSQSLFTRPMLSTALEEKGFVAGMWGEGMDKWWEEVDGSEDQKSRFFTCVGCIGHVFP